MRTPAEFNQEIRDCQRNGDTGTSHAMNMYEALYGEATKMIAELEKERDEARRDAKAVALAANAMMNKIEHRDYRYAIAIMEKYK